MDRRGFLKGAGQVTVAGAVGSALRPARALIGMLGGAPSGTAPAMSWKKLPVGAGGYVRGLIMAADGTMVGRTDTAGAYLYDSATSSWNQLITPTSMPASFVDAHFNVGLGGVYEFAIAPSNTQIFYMCYCNGTSGQSSMWKSTNQGGSWTELTGFTPVGNNPNDSNAQNGQKIAVDPANANVVYVGTEGGAAYSNTTAYSVGNTVSSGGITYICIAPTTGNAPPNATYWAVVYMQVSTDGGSTWASTSVPVGTGAGICGIVFGTNVVGGVTQTIYACSQGNGVYVTTNGGSTWALTTGGPTTVQNAQIDSSGNYWCSGNAANVWRYTASTSTWANLASGNGNGMQCVAVNPLNNNEVVGIDGSGHITWSGDGGSTWTGINSNTALSSTDIPWLGPTSTVGGSGNDFFLSAGNAIFSSSTSGLLYLSSGVGVWSMTVPSTVTGTTALTWDDMSVGIENLTTNEIIVPPGSGPVIASWDRAVFFLTPGTYPSYYLPVTDGKINAGWSVDYASSDPTFVCASVQYDTQLSGYSHDGGLTWTEFATFPTGVGDGGCIAASTPSNIVFGVNGSNAPSYTTDGGSIWTQISISGISSWSGFLPGAPSAAWRKICADRVSANTFYLYFGGNGLYRSTDGGATWTQQYAGWIESNHGYEQEGPQLKAVPGNAGHLFFTTGLLAPYGSINSPQSDAYFYRSTDGGVTWTQVSGVLQVSAFGFGKAKPGGSGYPAVFISGFVGATFGFWRSDDNCVTWTNIGTWAGPNGLASVTSMSGDMDTYGTCYVALGGFGPSGFGAGCSYAYYG